MPGPTKITINEPFKTGGQRTSVTVTSEPIEHTFDEEKLGEGPARAIAKLISDQIKAITEQASAATIAAREKARRALARGEAWAVERYGARPPTGSQRLFNDSGTLAELVARAASGVWEVVTSGNRLDQQKFGRADDFAYMLRRLRELVPALREPLEQPEVRRAIERTIGDVIRVGRAR